MSCPKLFFHPIQLLQYYLINKYIKLQPIPPKNYFVCELLQTLNLICSFCSTYLIILVELMTSCYNQSQMSQGEKVLRVYADGVFDSFHIGHSNMFKQCRLAFPDQKIWLIAGVCDQKDIEEHKGPTISSEEERIQMVAQNKYVDQVYPHAPWILTEQFLIKNNIDFVCHDDIPYETAGIDDAYAVCKRMGKFKATERTKGISTTDVVAKILKNKEMYYVRNLRRGVSRQKLGMSIFRYVKLRFQMYVCPHHFDHAKSD